jgi:predicted  nucleic acid-binding Zn-ribbon protein
MTQKRWEPWDGFEVPLEMRWGSLARQQNSRECHKCGHVWNTKSGMYYITCPSCQSKVFNSSKYLVESWSSYLARAMKARSQSIEVEVKPNPNYRQNMSRKELFRE